MIKGRSDRQRKNTSITTAFGAVVMLLLLSVSCGGDKKELVAVEFDPETTYSMRTTEIVSLISDSGITRYRLTAPEMLVFDKAAEPYMYFPQGAYAERFDSLFVAEASFVADTVYYWNEKGFMKAIGNVEMKNLEGEHFETELLFWDEAIGRFYSDSFIQITRKDRIITGIGFEANQNMTQYRIYHPQGSFPVSEEQQPANSTATRSETDSTAVTPPQGVMPTVNRERPQRRAVPGAAPVLPDSVMTETPPAEYIEEPPADTPLNPSEP